MDIKEIRHKNLKELLESRCGNKQAEFGRKTGISGAYVYQLISQRRPVGDRTARKIESSFELPRGWMDSIHASNDKVESSKEFIFQEKYVLIPRYEARISLGAGCHNGDHVEISKTHAFRKDWIKKNNWREEDLCVVEASGHSMEPQIRDGDMLLVNTADKEVQSGKVYVLLFPGEGIRAKRIHRMADGRIRVSSDNPDKAQYPDEYYSPGEAAHLNIVGKVVQRSGEI